MHHTIEVEDLHYSYPDGKAALRGVNLVIAPGEKAALVGPNGAGKSTLILHLNGILKGEGEIKVCGVSITDENIGQVRASVGLVFQDPDDQLFSPTVFEDVAFVVREVVAVGCREIQRSGEEGRHLLTVDGRVWAVPVARRGIAAPGDSDGGDAFDRPFVDVAVVVDERSTGRQRCEHHGQCERGEPTHIRSHRRTHHPAEGLRSRECYRKVNAHAQGSIAETRDTLCA